VSLGIVAASHGDPGSVLVPSLWTSPVLGSSDPLWSGCSLGGADLHHPDEIALATTLATAQLNGRARPWIRVDHRLQPGIYDGCSPTAAATGSTELGTRR